MAKSPRTQPSLFQWIADRHVDSEHPLMTLAEKIDWAAIDRVLAPYYSPGKGRPAKSTRLMVGLMILKHRFDLSDEAVVSGLHENFVWMVFFRVPCIFSLMVDRDSPHDGRRFCPYSCPVHPKEEPVLCPIGKRPSPSESSENKKVRSSLTKKCDGVHGHLLPDIGECIQGGRTMEKTTAGYRAFATRIVTRGTLAAENSHPRVRHAVERALLLTVVAVVFFLLAHH